MADYAGNYIKWLKEKAPEGTKGQVSFTQTRCHFRMDKQQGGDKIVTYGDDFVVVTHGNLHRSFDVVLFSLVLPRD